jgi:hypothetical protein
MKCMEGRRWEVSNWEGEGGKGKQRECCCGGRSCGAGKVDSGEYGNTV